MRIRDWSSDVCSSDLGHQLQPQDDGARGAAEPLQRVEQFAGHPEKERTADPEDLDIVRQRITLPEVFSAVAVAVTASGDRHGFAHPPIGSAAWRESVWQYG